MKKSWVLGVLIALNLIVLNLIVAACSSSQKTAGGDICITDAVAKNLLAKIEPTVDKMIAGTGDPKAPLTTKLVEQKCIKRIYERGGYNFIFYKNPTDPADTIQGAMIPVTEGPRITAAECLTRALSTIDQIHATYGRPIINAVNERYPWFAGDADLGPTKWLTCTDKTGPEYFRSIGTLLHELNHELTKEHCLYSAIGQKPLCFEFPEKMDPNSIARLKKIPVEKNDERTSIESVEDIYLNSLGQDLLGLLDETNAYILTERVSTLVLERYGKKAYLDADGRREGNFAPLFQVLSARYLTELKRKNPALYNKVMSNPQNVASFHELFTAGEISYNAWLKAVNKNRFPVKKYERDLWDQYMALKPQIFPVP